VALEDGADAFWVGSFASGAAIEAHILSEVHKRDRYPKIYFPNFPLKNSQEF
jgi:hypothetical protein